ncbi:hypothetical protein [Natrinema salsiterrestre]|uniref:Uncharacterized protein n=1 Tax=Natrinema salsiterrestre TaxID=2950540 RepID=A0A9Q4Q025_9EURY|nr:hypothetical protein [Natrinema salsiterrestre]MDF9745845.1 hypothetical protein [Natrinema salsiterrestre]
MSTTTTTHETISDAQQDDIVLKQSGSYYVYLGTDGKGYHHHVDEATNTVYVTPGHAERFLPDNAGLYWFRVRGDLDHIEDIEQDKDRKMESRAHIKSDRSELVAGVIVTTIVPARG